jgi:putative Ca2+/H+ antiporter (TMEM165/GDT1 family)
VFCVLEEDMDWSALVATFGLVFVAELGDKTQLAVITQTCKYRRPWAVFLGGSLALTAVTLIGALGGELLGRLIPQSVLRTIASVAFVVMGVLIGREAFRAGQGTIGAECELVSESENAFESSALSKNWRAFGSTFGLLFLAELGDKTQLSVLSLASKYGVPWLVFLGGSAALVAVTALGAIGGQGLCSLIPERVILRISAVAFVVMGILMGIGVL